MSFLNLEEVGNFSAAGFILNVEERTVMNTSLQLKKEEERFKEIGLWGKVLGIHRDYYVAQANSDDYFVRKLFYSTDLSTWLQLPEITVDELKKIEELNGRFYGDPAFEYQTVAPPKEERVEEGGEEAQPLKNINELKRLAGVVALISHQAQIVPRGAYYRDSVRKLQVNPDFSGIPKSDLKYLTSYFHFRPGFDINKKTLLERGQTFDESIDIFDHAANDEPKGCWAIQLEKGESVAIIRNLIWPGYTFYHCPRPTKWGAVYIGTGQKNNNIGYMLPAI